ncbi:Phosphatase 2C family protein [Rhynchospora pubera]|uniref:protein-serine/threonine phosphatase n=1 Tax=Rhynchospora pubera TaxID=906938 RepID=A0AAV8EIV3_9POAL|nr:Phosphatase 2C family protein [Rhynchospora pubera]
MASVLIRRLMMVGRLVWKKKMHGEKENGRRGVRISYGYYCVENLDGSEGCVVAQKVETDSMPMRLFGVFDKPMEGFSANHLQSRLLPDNKNLNESKVRRNAKEAIKNAYKKSSSKLENGQRGDKNGGFATLLLSSNRDIVVASSGGYELLLCKGSTATPIGTLKSSDLIMMPCIAHKEADKAPEEKLIIKTRKMEPNTSFIILASNGVWEVLGYQEAMHLLDHIEDAQKAAECLAEEAINRLSKSSISCLVIRFRRD